MILIRLQKFDTGMMLGSFFGFVFESSYMFEWHSAEVMNFVIGLNVVWVFTESVIDLNDWQDCSIVPALVIKEASGKSKQ